MENLFMKSSFKSILNVTWKVGLGIFGLAAAAIGILIANVWYEKTRGRDSYNDKNLSADIVVEAYNNNRMRVKNKKTGKYTTPKVMWVSGTPERDSLTVFCDKNGLRGYINVNTGEIVIPTHPGIPQGQRLGHEQDYAHPERVLQTDHDRRDRRSCYI